MTFEAQRERFQAAQYEPAIKRRRHRARRVLQKFETFIQRRVICHKRAADDIAMSAEIFGGRVHGQIRAQLERPLQIRRSKSIIHAHQNSASARQRAQRLNVHDFEQRIRRR